MSLNSFIFLFFSLLISNFYSQKTQIPYEGYFLNNKSILTKDEIVRFSTFHDSVLNNFDVKKITILGYANDIGKSSYNYKLSNNRAKYILKLINTDADYDVEFSAQGEIKTLDQADLDQQLIKNRKVVINYFLEIKKNKLFSVAEFKVGEKMTLKNIGFYGNSPEFLPRYKETLDQLAADLLKNKSYYVEIQGHIYDERNYSDKHTIYTNYPPTLSEDRAKTIYDYLIKSGVDSTRLSYVGFQGKFPLHKNPQDDRRVEIEVVKIQPE